MSSNVNGSTRSVQGTLSRGAVALRLFRFPLVLGFDYANQCLARVFLPRMAIQPAVLVDKRGCDLSL